MGVIDWRGSSRRGEGEEAITEMGREAPAYNLLESKGSESA